MLIVPATSDSATSVSPRLLLRAYARRRGERLVHVDVAALGDHALGLLDRDPAGESVLQLSFANRGFAGGLVLDDGDAGHVGKGLGERDLGAGERDGL